MIRAITDRLVLRDVTPNDAPFLLELLNDPGFIGHIGDRKVRTVEEARSYITDKIIAQYVDKGYGMYLVAIKKGASDDGEILGQCGLVKREGLDTTDLGFAFLEKYCGKGYGYESAQAVLGIAKKDLGLSQIAAITGQENIASQKLLTKLGLKYLRTIQLPKIDEPCLYYELDLTQSDIA